MRIVCEASARTAQASHSGGPGARAWAAGGCGPSGSGSVSSFWARLGPVGWPPGPVAGNVRGHHRDRDRRRRAVTQSPRLGQDGRGTRAGPGRPQARGPLGRTQSRVTVIAQAARDS